MNSNSSHRDRYPGLISFNEKQNDLFFGREKEKKELLNLILAERTVVLFSKSGVGKSSLLNAGICPLLAGNGLYPLKIRFPNSITDTQTQKASPTDVLFKILEERSDLNFNRKAILGDAVNPQLWELFKVISPPLDQTPFLIFDQFEEFFYYPEKLRNKFLIQLGELLHDQPPNRILDWIGKIKSAERTAEHIAWTKQPRIKCIFIIREDKLSEMDSLKKYIPIVLRNRYKLSPLSIKNAREAITGPGLLEQSLGFQSKKFKFPDKALLNHILLILAGVENLPPLIPETPPTSSFSLIRSVRRSSRTSSGHSSPTSKVSPVIQEQASSSLPPSQETISPSDSEGPMSGMTPPIATSAVQPEVTPQESTSTVQSQGSPQEPTFDPPPGSTIDGTQLQTVCTFIEKRVIASQNRYEQIVPITTEILNPDKEIRPILDNFYINQLNTLEIEKDRKEAATFIESHLVGGGARTSVTEKQMLELLDQNIDLVKKMIDARLIKEEFTHLGKTYELSHDTLVPAVARLAEKRKIDAFYAERRSQRRYIFTFLALLVVSIGLFVVSLVILNRLNDVLNTNNLNLADKYYQQSNDYIAFSIWDNYLQKKIPFSYSQFVKDSLQSLVRNKGLYDISQGAGISGSPDSLFIVQSNDRSVYIWHIPPHANAAALRCQVLNDASNAELSDTHDYITYRTKNGALKLYSLHDSTILDIPGARVNTKPAANRNKAGSLDTDMEYRKKFITGTNIVIYINDKEQIEFFDADRHHQIRLPISGLGNDEYSAGALGQSVQASSDHRHIAVNKNDTISIWNVGDPDKPYLERLIRGAGWLYSVHPLNYLIYTLRLKNELIVDTIAEKPLPNPRHIHFYQPPVFSPSLSYFYIITNGRSIVIYDIPDNRIDTTLLPAKHFPFPRSDNFDTPSEPLPPLPPTDQKFYFPEWVGTQSILQYDDGKENILLNLETRQSYHLGFTGTSNHQFNDEVSRFATMDSTGTLKVLDMQSNNILFSDSTHLKKQDLEYPYGRRSPWFKLNSSGNKVAYMKMDTNNEYKLHLVDIDKRLPIFNPWPNDQIGDLFTDNCLYLYDPSTTRGGIMLLNGRPRNLDYYRHLYPPLTEGQRNALGISTLFKSKTGQP